MNVRLIVSAFGSTLSGLTQQGFSLTVDKVLKCTRSFLSSNWLLQFKKIEHNSLSHVRDMDIK